MILSALLPTARTLVLLTIVGNELLGAIVRRNQFIQDTQALQIQELKTDRRRRYFYEIRETFVSLIERDGRNSRFFEETTRFLHFIGKQAGC